VIAHAQRTGIVAGELGAYLARQPGGLKGIVQVERQLRRDAGGAVPRESLRERLAARLRDLPAQPLPALGEEFALVLARRGPDGEIVLLGEVADEALFERAARKLLD